MAVPPPPPPPPPPKGGSSSGVVDMSAKIGGRVVTPAIPVVDSKIPTPQEVAFDKSLQGYIQENIPLEPNEGILRRERVLNRMGTLCREWIQSVCRRQGLPPDVIGSAGGQLFTSGSYRLGVHEPGADIDTILVAPNMCTRQEFFGAVLEENEDGTSIRDPESLAERIRTHPDVTNFVPVEGAAVPILTFDWEGVNIDLLFARLNSASVPPTLDIDNDSVLDGVDSATEKSLNGPRVTNLIAALVSGTGDREAQDDRYQRFLTVVRCVRKWAKARGLYSNKLGYWGGVNINIAVALTVQLYPRATPASLLRKFFLVFKKWRWPNPIMLTETRDAGYGLPVWNPQHVQNARQVAPMITPAYPAMNSTLSVSRQTLQILHEEFCRGFQIVDKLWKQSEANPTDELHWGELFEPSDFFISYPHYLSLCIVGPTQSDAQAWAGFVESRLRKLVSDMLGRSLPLSKIQLWPKKFEFFIADKAALVTAAQRRNCITYFVGFQVDLLRMRGKQLNIELQMHNFRDWELSRFQPLVPGMDVLAKCFKVKELPKVVFEGIYDGGKLVAMKKRRHIRDADPKRQERKRLAKLQVLKAKMAEIQRKKEESNKDKSSEESGDKKRKIEETDGESERDAKLIKTETDATAQGDVKDEPAENQDEEEQEEADLLANAIDVIQSEELTREEAEAERAKLLEGGFQAEDEDYVYEGDDDADYIGRDAARVGTMNEPTPATENKTTADKRSLPLEKEEAEILRKVGYTVVSDDDVAVLGSNVILPWRKPSSNDGNTSKSGDANQMKNIRIKFRTKFDIVELDTNGNVIDKGDDDFMPSLKWTGRRGGFEFKLGERGVGYYRTGKKVVVPSNTAY